MDDQSDLDFLNKPIGDKEPVRKTLAPKKVKIVSVVIQTEKKDGSKLKSPLAHLMLKHPDSEDLLKINKIKYLKDEKLVVNSFWVQLDEDNNIQKSSAIDVLLKVTNSKTLADTYGKEIDTVTESKESSYLCIKAY